MDAVATPEMAQSAPERPSLLGAFFAPVLVVLAVIGSWAMKEPAKPALGAVRDFTLTDQTGKKLSLRDLEGRPWVADFVFTRCGGPCPRMSEGMEQLQAMLARTDARLVSFSVDPENDSPEALRAFAEAHGVGPGWRFLTGDPEDLRAVRASFGSFETKKMNHTGLLVIGDEPAGRWITVPAITDPDEVVAAIDRLLVR